LAYKNNIPIKKSWGQNFLIDQNTINKIINIINPQLTDKILEIGPGHGALTNHLIKKCNEVHAVEIDPLLCEKLKDYDKLILYNEDILKWDFKKKISFNKIVGNIPYNISSQIIFKFLSANNWDVMILMLQKEMANRIISNKDCRDYGRISVMVQNLCKASYMCDISRNVFHPKPNVDSSILMFQHKRKNIDVNKFSLFIKNCFKQRRKKLKNNLQEAYSQGLLGKYTDLRPEHISPEEYLILFNKIYF
tara:strand:- start:432 stop:1178 length:747 start_codon:yes stop_codon:yes gene_type:complete